MKERGFLLAGPMLYAAIGAGVVILGLTAALKIQSSRLETCRTEFAAFRLETKLIGDAQEKANREREAVDRKLKEKTDADHKTAVARLQRDIKRVRDLHARSSLAPEARPASRSPHLSCFDRAEFTGALRDYEAEIIGLLAEGAENTLSLDAAKAWAQALPTQ